MGEGDRERNGLNQLKPGSNILGERARDAHKTDL